MHKDFFASWQSQRVAGGNCFWILKGSVSIWNNVLGFVYIHMANIFVTTYHTQHSSHSQFFFFLPVKRLWRETTIFGEWGFAKGVGNFSLLRRQFQFAPKFGFVTSYSLKISCIWMDNQPNTPYTVVFEGKEECSGENSLNFFSWAVKGLNQQNHCQPVTVRHSGKPMLKQS